MRMQNTPLITIKMLFSEMYILKIPEVQTSTPPPSTFAPVTALLIRVHRSRKDLYKAVEGRGIFYLNKQIFHGSNPDSMTMLGQRWYRVVRLAYGWGWKYNVGPTLPLR